MVIKINGKSESVDKPVNLVDLVAAKGLVPEHIVIEHNHSIIPRGEWKGILLKDNDNIEIVSFVGGG